MPGFVTHYLFGVSNYHQLRDAQLRSMIVKNHGPYCLGLQGPDVFFYYPLSYFIHPHNIGSIAHSKDTGLFYRNLLEARSLFKNDPGALQTADAYLIGFLGHYTLDCTAHPFVYAFTHYDPLNPPPGKVNFGQHAYLETEIDSELLMAMKQKKPSDFHMDATIRLTRRERQIIGRLVAFAYNKTWPDLHVTGRQVRAASLWMHHLTGLMRDPSGQKKVLVRMAEEKLVGVPMISAMIPSDTIRFVCDPLNLYGRKWKHPWTLEMSDDSFYDLFHLAGEHYQRRLKAYCSLMNSDFPPEETARFLEEYGNLSFSSGLPCSEEVL